MEKIKLPKKHEYYSYVKNNYVYVAKKDCYKKQCFRPHYMIDKQVYVCITNYNEGCQDIINEE